MAEKTALTILFLALVAALPVVAAEPVVTEADFIARDFRFQSGEVLPEVRLHYRTIGQPQRGPDGRIGNAVLLLHGTTATGRQFLAPGYVNELYGPGQPLDTSKFFLIVPDGLGRGGSTKPSDGLRAKFPRYGYLDVVAAQHLLVTRGLGVDHLRLVLGTSMGGMQTWLWGERHPDMMDALLPITSQPTQMSGRNLLWRKVLTESIRSDPDWQGGNYAKPPSHWVKTVPVFTFMTGSAVRLQEQGPTYREAGELYDRLVAAALRNYDANDFLYWFESSWDYDPEPGLGRIRARLTAVNFADDMINPSELELMDKLVAKVPAGRSVLIPADPATQGHLNQHRASLWKRELVDLLR